jgi:1-aminocyclopropane-1-carboxylate deaminase
LNTSLFNWLRIDSLLPKSKTRLEPLEWPVAQRAGVKFYIKRDDQIHPQCSGNKWYKLAFNLERAIDTGAAGIISFGGGYSNHLHALAHLGKMAGLPTVGFVRGRYQDLTPTLEDCQGQGMVLEFLTKAEWKERHLESFTETLQNKYPGFYVIPEGGDNQLGLQGCAAMGASLLQSATKEGLALANLKVLVACGTGTTLAGLVSALPAQCQVDGISVLKGPDTLTETVAKRVASLTQPGSCCGWRIHTEYHCGGYAKLPRNLLAQMRSFEQCSGVLLDPVYTSKVVLAARELINAGYYNPGDSVILMHTGGLQGRRGFNLGC